MERPRINLNDLLIKVEEQNMENETSPVEKTKDEKILELRSIIMELESKLKEEEKRKEEFMSMSAEGQELELAKIQSNLPEGEKYTLEEYLEELNSTKLNVRKVRLEDTKRRLEQLLSE